LISSEFWVDGETQALACELFRDGQGSACRYVGETLLLVKWNRVVDSGGDVAFGEKLTQGVAPIS